MGSLTSALVHKPGYREAIGRDPRCLPKRKLHGQALGKVIFTERTGVPSARGPSAQSPYVSTS